MEKHMEQKLHILSASKGLIQLDPLVLTSLWHVSFWLCNGLHSSKWASIPTALLLLRHGTTYMLHYSGSKGTAVIFTAAVWLMLLCDYFSLVSVMNISAHKWWMNWE